MENTIDKISKTLNFGFFIILCLVVFSPFNTLSQTSTLQFTEEEKVWISSHSVINVGNERFWPPMDFVKDGEPMGYSIDLMDLIAKKIGIEINYINGLSWLELLEALNNETIDVLPAISKTDEREAYIKFSKSYIKLPYVKVINGALPNSEDSKLENKTIAVFKGSNVENALINEYQNINLIYLKTVLEALQKVSTGEVDVFIENLAVIAYYLNENYVPNIKLNTDNLTFLNSPDVFIGVLKKNEILGKLIDKGLEAVSKEEIILLKNKWLPIETSKPEIFLTEEERQWISSQAPMKVANETDVPPFNFSDNGVPKGYSIELIELVSEKIGLQLEFVDGNSWAEIIEKFKLGELNILPFVHFTEERNEYMSFTKSYESNYSVLVVNIQSTNIKTLEDLEFKKVAVISNYVSTEILKNKYPNIELVFVKSATEALTEVSLGNVDGFIGTLGVLSYILDQKFIPNIKIVGDIYLKTKEENQIHFAVLKDSIILLDILQKGLDAVSNEEINKIRQKWLPISIAFDQKEESFDLSVLWKTIIGVIILFVIFFFSFKWLFKRVIKEKTALEFGSRKFRVKTNFYLSVLTIVIAGIGWLGIVYIETEFSNNIKLQLENDLASANGKLDFWLNQKKAYLKFLGQNQILVDLSNDLVENSTSYTKEQYDGVNNRLTQFFEEHNYQGSYLINRQGINIGLVDTKYVGELNSIAGYKPKLIKQVFKGEVVFIPPLLTVNVNYEIAEVEEASRMYFAIPIENNENHVIAALIQKIDPSRGFSEILQLSHVGETGESYIFSREGRMLSKSRFEKKLNLQLNSSGVPNIEIRDPGGNLSKGFISVGSIDQNPLTLMAQSAIAGNNGVNVDGYNDYRGVQVMGAWMWIEELELGLATEIDVSEALKLFYFIRIAAIVVLGIALILIIGSILFTLTLGEKANIALIKAKDELEGKVIKRTSELNNEKVFLNSLINAIPDPICYKNTELKYLGANKAFENYTGHASKDFIGRTDSYFSLEENEKSIKSDKECLKKLKPILVEHEFVNPEGKKIIEEILKTPFTNDNGDLSGIISIARDITERKKAEEDILKHTQELNNERVFLNTLINAIPDVIFYKDINFRFLGVNKAFEKQIGFKKEEIIGKTVSQFIPGKLSKHLEKTDNLIIEKSEPISMEFEYVDPDGNKRVYDSKKSPFFNEAGELLGIIGISRDITERKKTEEEILKRTQELNDERVLLTTLINNIPDHIFYKDINYNYLGANESFLKVFDKKINEIIGKSDFEFLPLKEAEAFSKVNKKVLKSLKTITIEHERIDVHGNKIIQETRKTPFFNNKGELIGLIGISRDITESKKAEEEIRASENKFRSITNTATDAIISAGKKGLIESWNIAAEKIFGYTEQEAIGQKLEIIIPNKYHKDHQMGMKRVLGGGEKKAIGRVMELEGQHKNGELFPIELSLSVFKGKDGLNFSGIIRDITERKKLEEIILKAKERMEDELNVAKEIQMSMLPLTFPAFPNRNEIDIYAELIPAREVGGDFYDFYFLDKNHICFVIGDVSGKGVPAALMMAVTKTLLKSRARNDKSTASILTHVNNEIAKENDAYMFITVFMAILNTNTGELVYSNAGHNPSYVISKENKELTRLTDLHGPVVGAMEDIAYGETQLILKKNDIVLAYTDGVTESQNIKEELYSDARFKKLLQNGEYDSTKALIKLIIDSVKEFEGNADQFDDITVMALEYCQDPNTISSIKSSININNELKQITTVIEWFEAFALENKMPFVMIQKFSIAFDELLNNIISYAYNDEHEHEIEIEIELKSKRLIITISDDGIPFNPFKKEPPDTMLSVEDRIIGGMGIHLVKNLMDEYDYKRNVNNNVITIIKYNINT